MGEQNRRVPPPRSVAEWTTFGASLVVVLGLVGVALVEQFGRREPPGVRIEVGLTPADVARRDGVFYIPFTATNQGGEAAVDVGVVFEVRRGEEVVEESSATLPFLPVGGSVAGEMVTTRDSATHELAARVGSVQSP